MVAGGDPVSAKRDHILHQYELHLAERNHEYDVLDRKAREVIGLASVVTAIIGALSLNTPNPTLEHRLFVTIIFVVYVLAALVAFAALYPRKMEIPGKDSAAETRKSLAQEPDAYFLWIMDSYAESLAINKKVNHVKQRLTRLAIALIILDIVLTVVLALLIWL